MDLETELKNLKIQKQHLENELLLIKDKITITTTQLQLQCLHLNWTKHYEYDGHKHYCYLVCNHCLLEK